MTTKTGTKTARIKRKFGESITIDGPARVTALRIKGENWIEVEYREGVRVDRVEEKSSDSTCQTACQ